MNIRHCIGLSFFSVCFFPLVSSASSFNSVLSQSFHSWESSETSQIFSIESTSNQLTCKYVPRSNLKGEAYQLNDWGQTLYRQGQVTEALKKFQESLKIYNYLGDCTSQANILSNIAIIHREIGKYPQALQYYDQALKYQEASGKPNDGIILTNMAVLYGTLGQYEKAIQLLQKTATISQQIVNFELYGTTLSNIGIFHRRLGQYNRALEYSRQALSVLQKSLLQTSSIRSKQAIALNSMGLAYERLGQFNQALLAFEQGLEIAKAVNNKLIQGSTLINMGEFYDNQGQYQTALQTLHKAVDIARENESKSDLGQALHQLGIVYNHLNQYENAETTFWEALEVWESLRSEDLKDIDRVSLFETQIETYSLLQQVLINEDKWNLALEVSEAGRARAFIQLLANKAADQTLTLIKAPKIQQIQQIAKKQNATLVEYSIISPHDEKEELYIWIVKPTGEIAFRQVDLTQSLNSPLQELIASSRESMDFRGRGSFEREDIDEVSQVQTLQKLHKILIEPIAELLPKNPDERVIFIPHRSLFLVPFPALQDKEEKYLIEKHTILTAPAIQVLDLTYQQRKKVDSNSAKNNLVVGNPTMPYVTTQNGESSTQLSQLLGAEKEAVEIAQLLNTKAITKEQATETAIVKQISQARVIHLATHGLLDDFSGLGVPGAIALAPSNQDDGFLTASEIIELELNAELVVLSACDTGRGEITGDGVIGLSRSLITAGAPSVVVSLWSVPDAPTASLMTEFYRHLEAGKDKAQALRQAMLTTMKQKKNPRDWAAFTLIGEAD